jgi:hypothetical protein
MAQRAERGQYPLPESPVSVYYDGDPRLNRMLIGALNTEIAERSGHVASGSASDHADYKERCGYIAGLKRAVEIAQETEKKLRD